MKIDKITKNKNKYILKLDNGDEIKTYDEVILNNNLLFNKEIDDNLLNKILDESNYYEMYYKVIKYISTKMRSTYEIEKYLEKQQFNNKKKLINELKEKKLLNDLLFVKAFIQDKINLTNNGPYKIKKELLDHNISESIIDDELSVFNEELVTEKLNKIIAKQLKINRTKSKYMLKQKLVNNLINLGYSKETILTCIDNYEINDSDVLKKEYDILYKKLSKKYSENELETKIKNKLYQKGFDISDINNILEK